MFFTNNAKKSIRNDKNVAGNPQMNGWSLRIRNPTARPSARNDLWTIFCWFSPPPSQDSELCQVMWEHIDRTELINSAVFGAKFFGYCQVGVVKLLFIFRTDFLIGLLYVEFCVSFVLWDIVCNWEDYYFV